MRPPLLLPSALLAAGLMPAAVFAQSDREVAERAIEVSAAVCPGHSAERTGPTVRAVPVGALRVLARRDFVLCPDRRLEGDAAVVFYPQAGVFAWNPDNAASGKALVSIVDTLTRSEEFPVQTSVWNNAGKPLQQQVVPAFEPRPDARRSRW